MADPIVDEGFDLLPAGSEPPDPDTEIALEDALAAGDDTALAVQTGPPPPLGRSYAFDFAAHLLVPGQAGGPLMTYGLGTLAVWIEKCLRTRRDENAACDPDFGVEVLPIDLLDGGPFDAGAIAEYQGAVRRGLLVHPRVADVQFGDGSVAYTPGDDAVTISFRVVPEGDDLDEITFNLPVPVGAPT